MNFFQHKKWQSSIRILTCGLILIFGLGSITPAPNSYAQLKGAFDRLAPGKMIPLSAPFTPVLLRGLQISNTHPLELSFIVDSGDSQLEEQLLTEETKKLIQYFLASLTVPEEELWVNLSPHEPDRIIPNELGQTEMGRDLLAQDYLLKQLTTSLLYPEEQPGKDFWDRVHQKIYKLYGTRDIPVDLLTKVWIVPERAEIYQKNNTALVVDSYLQVMMEEDYIAMANQKAIAESRAPARDFALQGNRSSGSWVVGSGPQTHNSQPIANIESQILKELILPEIEKEINQGKTFAPLRQIYHSLILAHWYKKTLRESILSQFFTDKNRIQGLKSADQNAIEKIYLQYTKAFQTGAYQFIKEDLNPKIKETVPRKYFSGGVLGRQAKNFRVLSDLSMLSSQGKKTWQRLLVKGGTLAVVGLSLILQEAPPPMSDEQQQPLPIAIPLTDSLWASADQVSFERKKQIDEWRQTALNDPSYKSKAIQHLLYALENNETYALHAIIDVASRFFLIYGNEPVASAEYAYNILRTEKFHQKPLEAAAFAGDPLALNALLILGRYENSDAVRILQVAGGVHRQPVAVLHLYDLTVSGGSNEIQTEAAQRLDTLDWHMFDPPQNEYEEIALDILKANENREDSDQSMLSLGQRIVLLVLFYSTFGFALGPAETSAQTVVELKDPKVIVDLHELGVGETYFLSFDNFFLGNQTIAVKKGKDQTQWELQTPWEIRRSNGYLILVPEGTLLTIDENELSLGEEGLNGLREKAPEGSMIAIKDHRVGSFFQSPQDFYLNIKDGRFLTSTPTPIRVEVSLDDDSQEEKMYLVILPEETEVEFDAQGNITLPLQSDETGDHRLANLAQFVPEGSVITHRKRIFRQPDGLKDPTEIIKEGDSLYLQIPWTGYLRDQQSRPTAALTFPLGTRVRMGEDGELQLDPPNEQGDPLIVSTPEGSFMTYERVDITHGRAMGQPIELKNQNGILILYTPFMDWRGYVPVGSQIRVSSEGHLLPTQSRADPFTESPFGRKPLALGIDFDVELVPIDFDSPGALLTIDFNPESDFSDSSDVMNFAGHYFLRTPRGTYWPIGPWTRNLGLNEAGVPVTITFHPHTEFSQDFLPLRPHPRSHTFRPPAARLQFGEVDLSIEIDPNESPVEDFEIAHQQRVDLDDQGRLVSRINSPESIEMTLRRGAKFNRQGEVHALMTTSAEIAGFEVTIYIGVQAEEMNPVGAQIFINGERQEIYLPSFPLRSLSQAIDLSTNLLTEILGGDFLKTLSFEKNIVGADLIEIAALEQYAMTGEERAIRVLAILANYGNREAQRILGRVSENQTESSSNNSLLQTKGGVDLKFDQFQPNLQDEEINVPLSPVMQGINPAHIQGILINTLNMVGVPNLQNLFEQEQESLISDQEKTPEPTFPLQENIQSPQLSLFSKEN